MKFLSLSLLFIVFASDLIAAPAPEAARVAIIRYDDKTETKNFEYMPGSLQEAITKSMHKKFDFIEVDAGKVEPIVSAVRAKNGGKLTPKEAAEICRQADIDILIYGSFALDKANNELEIRTDISLGAPDKFRVLRPVENRIDATIFKAADKVAGDITAEITKVALEQQQAKGKTGQQTAGKTQLEKTEKPKIWADINWMISVAPGPVLLLTKRNSAEPKIEGMVDILAARRIKHGWHIGLLGSWGFLRSQSTSSTERSMMEVGAGAVTMSYFWDISARWRATSLIGGGYYFGKFERYLDCGSACNSVGYVTESTPVRNPFAVTRLGIHFLILAFLSAGLEVDYRLYFDSPSPVQALRTTASISLIF